MHCYFLIFFLLNSEEITLHLPLVSTCFLYALVFPYIFLLVDCFEWALIGDIESIEFTQHSHSFQMGGSILPLVSTCFLYATGISLYFLIVDCFKWLSLATLKSIEFTQHSAVLNRGVHQFYPGKSKNLSSFQVLLLLHRALSFL